MTGRKQIRVGVGFTNTGGMRNDGTGWAVIGTGGDGGTVQKYSVNGYKEPTPSDSQTLMDTSLTVVDGVTTMTFTKYLEEPGEQPIYETGENKGIFAGLDGNDQLEYHKGGDRHKFILTGADAGEVADVPSVEDETETSPTEAVTSPTEAHSHEGHSHEEVDHEEEAPVEEAEPVAEPVEGGSGAGYRSVGLSGVALAAALLA